MVKEAIGDVPDSFVRLVGKSKVVAIDVETDGLNVRTSKLCLVQLHTKDTTILLQRVNPLPAGLYAMLRNPNILKVFHYGKFDLAMLLRSNPFIKVSNVADTFVAARVFDPKKNELDSYSLKSLVSKFFNYEIDKSVRSSNWSTDQLTDEQKKYASDDVRYLIPLLELLESRIPVDRFDRLYYEYRKVINLAKKEITLTA